jgi:hypothetical protein
VHVHWRDGGFDSGCHAGCRGRGEWILRRAARRSQVATWWKWQGLASGAGNVVFVLRFWRKRVADQMVTAGKWTGGASLTEPRGALSIQVNVSDSDTASYAAQWLVRKARYCIEYVKRRSHGVKGIHGRLFASSRLNKYGMLRNRRGCEAAGPAKVWPLQDVLTHELTSKKTDVV